MSTQYKIRNPEGLYFLTSTVIGWVDIFTRQIYRDIVIDSLKYCLEEKGLCLYAYVIMSNHIHFIASAEKKQMSLSDILRDSKKFISNKVKSIIHDESESRRNWMNGIFTLAGSTNPANKEFQLWQNDNHPVELFTFDVKRQKVDYIHQNPVRAGLVYQAQDWKYSSASSYAGLDGLINVEVLF